LPRCRRGDRQEPGPQLRLPPPDRLRQDRRLPLLRHRLLPLRPLLEAAAQALLPGPAQHQPHPDLRLHQEGGDPPADERHLDEFRDDHQDEREALHADEQDCVPGGVRPGERAPGANPRDH
ncbi:unnamed protein product, partial [Musa banksii]